MEILTGVTRVVLESVPGVCEFCLGGTYWVLMINTIERVVLRSEEALCRCQRIEDPAKLTPLKDAIACLTRERAYRERHGLSGTGELVSLISEMMSWRSEKAPVS